MNSNAKVSVVLPVYNVEKYIGRALDSLLNQSFRNFEAIIVDDCGHDGSVAIANEYAKKDDRFRIVHHEENLGTYHARHSGVKSSAGEYILFLDPDDELEYHSLDVLMIHAADKPDIVFFGTRQVPEPKIWRGRSRVPALKNEAGRQRVVSSILKCKGLSFGTEGKLVRKEVLERAYGMLQVPSCEKLVYSEDSLLFSALLMCLTSAENCNERLYVYHKNPTSITVKSDLDTVRIKASGLRQSIRYIECFDAPSDFDRYVRNKILKRFNVNLTRQEINIEYRYAKVLFYYLMLLVKTRGAKDLIKLIIYALTLKKY